MVRKYSELLLSNPWQVIVLTLMLTIASGYGIAFVHFKSDYRMFFSNDNPQLIAFETLQKTYVRDDNVLLVLTPNNGDVFTAQNLAIIEQLTKKLWQTPYSTRVDSITNFQNSSAEGDELKVADLISHAEQLNAVQIQHLKYLTLHEPLLVKRLISPDAKVTGINVVVKRTNENQDAETLAIATYVRNLVSELKQTHPEIEIRLTGAIMLDTAFSESSELDMKTLTPAMLVIIALALWWFLKSFLGMTAALLMMTLSIVIAVGLAGWLGIAFSPSSIPAPTIMLTLAVADTVHILTSYYSGLAKGQDKRSAIQNSMINNFKAIFFTNLTTAIGFLSMNFSDAPPFRDLGNITAMGVVAAYFLTITFLPALMLLLPANKGRIENEENAGSWSGKAVHRMVNFMIRHPGKQLAVLSVITLALLACIPLNTLDDEYVKYFDESVEFRQDTDYTTTHLTGIYNIEYSLEQGTQGGINEPAFYNQVEAFVNWYRQQPETIHVYALNDILKKLNQNMHGDDPAWFRLPDSREMAAQYLLMFEMSLPYGLDINDRVNVSKSATRVTVTLPSLSSQQSIDLEARAQAWLKANAPLIKNTDGTGATLLFSHIGQRNTISMISGELLSTTLISIILIFVLRSLGLGLLSLIPNLVPAGMAFGLWGLMVGQVGLASSVVAAMTLGILVDDTVHFLGKYQYARQEKNMDPELALHYAFSNVGGALWVTSAVLIMGFSLFTFSSFKINYEMGLLTSIIFALGLFAEFLLLPPILLLYEGLLVRINNVFKKSTEAGKCS
ncbi:MMPL family transporter [Methylomonas sp. AM2-LC]|uniref:efflux RND transporter permease subunit n=1 Tax=Methylomonas sp. AM2-LC TaxID=3153301 RepID=UPI003267187D